MALPNEDEILPNDVVMDLDMNNEHEAVRDHASIDDVMETLETLVSNRPDFDEELLAQFGRYMVTLIYYGGMKPNEAKAKAADRILRGSGTTWEDVGELLDMTKGGISSAAGRAVMREEDAKHLTFSQIDGPAILLGRNTRPTHPMADHKPVVYILEMIDPQPEKGIFTEQGPDVAPPEPKYATVTIHYAPTEWGRFSGIDVEYYLDEASLVDELYESEYFFSIEEAEGWHDWLEFIGLSVEADPADRLDPDTKREILSGEE